MISILTQTLSLIRLIAMPSMLRFGRTQAVALSLVLLGTLTAQAAPTVSLTSPTSGTVAVNPPGSFTLTASASDANGIAKVAFYSGTTLLAQDTTAPYSYTWSNVPKGSYTLTAKATSVDGSSTTSAPVTVIVNAKPTVSITLTQGVFAPGPVPLTATAADTDGTVAQVAFYADGNLIGTDSSSPYAVTWATVPAGVYMITAQATDNRGAVTTSAATPIVVGVAPTVTLTSPTANQSYGAPATVNLSATAVANGGATLGGVKFYQGTTLIATGVETTPGVYTASWSNVPVGSYSIKADAYDSSSLHTTSPAVPITVTTSSPPTVSLTSPTAGQTYTAPGSVTLTATASAASGATVSKVEFYQGSTLIGTATTAPYSVTWSSVPAGSYSLTAKVTDSLNQTATSSATCITVTAAGMQVYYLQTDHLDTPRLITNASNQVVWRNLPTTEPFGATPPEDDPQATGNRFTFNLRFPGQYFDQESNLNYNTFRDYDPQTGRYIQSDPIGLAGGINTYAYGLNNPIKNIDPKGLQVPMPAPPLPMLPPAMPNSPLGGDRLTPSGNQPFFPTFRFPKSFPNWMKCQDQRDEEKAECEQSCADTFERDEAECLVAKAGYGKAAQAICLGKAKEFYSQCLRTCK